MPNTMTREEVIRAIRNIMSAVDIYYKEDKAKRLAYQERERVKADFIPNLNEEEIGFDYEIGDCEEVIIDCTSIFNLSDGKGSVGIQQNRTKIDIESGNSIDDGEYNKDDTIELTPKQLINAVRYVNKQIGITSKGILQADSVDDFLDGVEKVWESNLS